MVFADNIIPGRSSAMVYAENRRAGRSSSVAEGGSRPSISIPGRQDRSASIASNRSDESVSILPVIRDEKPVASGNGVSVSISLAEPVLFLQGFDQNELSQRNTTMLRGSLHLKVTKPSKIKAISLNFKGKAETEWPEGVPPRRVEFKDAETIMNHTWPFFNAQFPTAENSHCADHVLLTKLPSVSTKEIGNNAALNSSSFDLFARSASPVPGVVTSRDAKRLSLQANQSRSFGKGETANGGPTVAQKGFKIFQPGDYIYNFELPLDSRLPETISVDLGHVKYELEAIVERSGAFRANLMGSKEVTLIRAPAEGSLEQVEPIAISRNWEDQLHYDIVISGKSFPLGSQVPIAFKLTPLAKVQCHRIKVFVTENVQYFTQNKRVHRLEPTRKIQLFEKRADAPSSSTYPGSSFRVTAGGGISYDNRDAAAQGDESVEHDPVNLLGNLETDQSIGPTEMEFNIQLPNCYNMKEKDKFSKLHFDTTYQNIQVNHWIKIVMRLSRPDETDPSKRRHFEISIDSPFHILSCRATQANIALPAYTSPGPAPPPADEYECGCPGAALRRRSTPPSSFIPTLSNLRDRNNSTSSVEGDLRPGALNRPPTFGSAPSSLTRPAAAHVHEPNSSVQRPMHLLRSPSFNPPAFDDSDPPPPLVTPPPDYDRIVGGDPRGALADYFSRLADEYSDDDEGVGRGRVDVPLTPGARINRSMDARRDWIPLDQPVTQ